MKPLVVSVFALLMLGATSASSVSVPQSEIDATNAHWTSLGVKLPPGGIVLSNPYAAPYSNRSFVVPWSWYQAYYDALRAHKPYPVEASALRADLPTLRFLMQKTYAGYGAASARGWSWDTWFRRWDAKLKSFGNAQLSLKQAFAPWGDYERFQLDNHSGVPGLIDYVSGSVSAVLATNPGASCTSLQTNSGRYKLDPQDKGQQPHSVQAWSGSAFSPAWYVSFPKQDGTARGLQCGTQHIALTPVANGETPPQTPSYSLLADGIAYIRMPTFNDANNAALTAVLSKQPGLGKERVVIFDLRGNEGGNAPSDLLNTWFAESAIENAGTMTQIGTQSCFRTALFFGLQQQLAHGLKPPANPAVTQFLQAVADTLKGPSDCSIVPHDQNSDGNLADHVFSVTPSQQGQTRVIALVDNGCGSDCEYMASILARLPDTVIAGTSTYGVMGFTQPGYFVLPHSRVPFRLALSRTDAYGDGRSVDGYGMTVDVLLATPKSQSRESLLPLARALE